MADITLNNQAGSLGTYNTQSLSLSSALVSVIIVDGLTLTMTADKAVWADGALTYTLTVSNTGGAFPYVAPVVSDTLDPTLITLVADSVKVGGTALVLDTDYTFDDTTGALSVTLDDIAVAGSTVLTFQVQRAA